jgi:signal transduction histidine kinase/ActR/RegA family two-component response regulator
LQTNPSMANDSLSSQCQAAQAQTRSERRFAALLENSPDIIAHYHRELRHQYVIPRIERVNGRPAADFMIAACPDLRARWSSALEAVFASGRAARVSFELADAAGEQRYYESRLVPEFAADGSVGSVLAVVSDETERRQLDQARGAAAMAPREADLRKNDFLAMLSHELRSDAGGHRLELQPASGALWVDGDLQRLTQVVANVLGNAAKYTPPGGRIGLVATREADMAVITVVDSGMAIAPDMLPRIFELFMQADAGPNRAQSSLGIGLALVKKLIELHGGTVTAHSDGLGHDSRVRITLPLLQDGEREAMRPPVSSESAPTPSPGCGEQRRVLIVDDHVDSAQALAALLRVSGLQPYVAHDGSHAVQLADECRPEVALLDIGLPDIDGREVARRIRASSWGSQALLIALSGWSSDRYQQESLEAGFDHYLVKPVWLDDLFGLMARPRPGTNPPAAR